jgi:FKBP-type peptidyl-prolyl cis-trans isomerase FkpA
MIERFRTPRWRTRAATAAVFLVAITSLLTFAACKNDKKSAPAPTATAVTGQTPAPPTEAAGTTTSAGGPDSPPAVDGQATVTASGLKIIDITVVPGGAVAEAGKTVTVNYTLWLSDGSKVQSSLDSGQPFKFTLGNNPPDVIAGWDEGVVGMTVGSKRRLIIPAELGYGAKGRGTIPPNAELTFDVDLLAVK